MIKKNGCRKENKDVEGRGQRKKINGITSGGRLKNAPASCARTRRGRGMEQRLQSFVAVRRLGGEIKTVVWYSFGDHPCRAQGAGAEKRGTTPELIFGGLGSRKGGSYPCKRTKKKRTSNGGT